MHNFDIGLLRADSLAQLILLELDLDVHGSLDGLDLDGFAILVGHEERDVVEKGVVSGVGRFFSSALVECFHVGAVVVLRAVLGDGGYHQICSVGYRVGLGYFGCDLNRVVLIYIGSLFGRLLSCSGRCGILLLGYDDLFGDRRVLIRGRRYSFVRDCGLGRLFNCLWRLFLDGSFHLLLFDRFAFLLGSLFGLLLSFLGLGLFGLIGGNLLLHRLLRFRLVGLGLGLGIRIILLCSGRRLVASIGGSIGHRRLEEHQAKRHQDRDGIMRQLASLPADSRLTHLKLPLR